ncbi:MAG: metallophosphoesterase [Anaerolineae bacterium]|nr:metallophosphoesterase [Anaerolineae bacterium]
MQHSRNPAVWAISDTHLSFAKPRDQTRFGEIWSNHAQRIKDAWEARVHPEDLVLLPGDLSWAHSAQVVQPDVDWLAALPGRKILARGNHDFWWKKLEQVRRQVLRPEVYAVQGTCLALDGLLVCGTMGHVAPNDPYFQKHKQRSYQRELHWLRQSLIEAEHLRANGEPVLLMMHYPPFTSDGQKSGFTEIIEQFQPNICVYGHLHFAHEWAVAADGIRHGTHYHLVAADYLNMTPRKIWPDTEPDNGSAVLTA